MIYKQRTAAHRTRTPRTEGGDVVVALKKSDLYSSPWKSADELRGGMDASRYKDYVLTLLFAKCVADRSKSDESKSDKNRLIDVPSGGSFDDLVTFKGDKEIGDKTNKAISKLAEGDGPRKIIDLADFNDEEMLGNGKGLLLSTTQPEDRPVPRIASSAQRLSQSIRWLQLQQLRARPSIRQMESTRAAPFSYFEAAPVGPVDYPITTDRDGFRVAGHLGQGEAS